MDRLATLTSDEQVSALFITLFGLLLLVTAAAVLWSLREKGDEWIEHKARFGRELRALWIGAMYITATSEIHDVIDLRQHPVLAALVGSDSLNVSARVSPKDNWNYLLGGNWQPDKRWSLTAEAGGLADRFQFIGSVMWRF